MTLTQILQKIRAAFYTRAEIDSMGGGASLDTTIRSKQNALSTAQLSAVNSGITSNKVSQYDEYINGASGQPVGTISWVMGSTVPAGYLICNGSAVSRTAYDKLFQAIGTKYGEGDGSTTFNLPNLIGKFLQGDVTSGTVKEAGLPNITGIFNPCGEQDTITTTSGSFYLIPSNQHGWSGATPGDDDNALIGFDASRSSSIYGNSETVQPPAITSIPCIKAFDSVIDATTVSVAQLSDTKVNKAGDTMTGSLTAPSFIANGIDCSVDSQGDGYIRYSNGLQICYGRVTNNNNVETGVTHHSFPVAFSAIPYLVAVPVCEAVYKIYVIAISDVGATTFDVNSWANYATPPVLTELKLVSEYVAIGRWK